MATWADVRRLALALPETSERLMHGNPSWRVRDALFAWDRPLRAADRAALAAAAPDGAVLGVRTADLDAKDALLGQDGAVFFTVPHFQRYAAVLVRLDVVGSEDLEEVLTDGWLARAPKRLAAAFLDGRA